MTEAYSSRGLTRAQYARSFVWIQLIFRFFLIIAKVVLALATFSSMCFVQFRLDCRTTPRYLQWSTMFRGLFTNYVIEPVLCRDKNGSRLRYIDRVALRYIN